MRIKEWKLEEEYLSTFVNVDDLNIKSLNFKLLKFQLLKDNFLIHYK